ncbi:hypothetical protein [Actinacidiphila paucisporea]|uniref:Cytochrome C oxidase subunit I n=1 Tax=Actinacidiphila paucisporea TaxID=310782 RepID=A0A1M7P7N7_9ACTN|nr:hypothetical protein [Actinacidiphila paucisporea]SHN12692.1 hypothetical protein SAMN05216499_121116 [Actinacidiphila paucisporea]
MKEHDDCERGLEQMAGYLLWNAEIEEARRRAAAFTSRLSWLTTAQRENVESVYVADRVEASRAMLIRNRDRAVELRGEYRQRYEELRKRCVAVAFGGVAVAAGLAAAVVLFCR